jgi:D-alanyl-D-alanine carboxypeptidase
MVSVSSEARAGLRYGVISLAAVAAAFVLTGSAADAHHHGLVRVHYVHRETRVHHAEEYSPPTASIIVDGNTGQVLEASNPDAPRHPASLTKIMTLYLLFERLDAGKITLDTPLKVSQHAADQDPTKLDLKPGSTIPVEEAIKGVVTRSANDAAVTIAENVGGSEEDFARQMTQKAHALGMSRTTYVNASGLPNDDQITTARDQALLGRAIQERFPKYYKYFSLPAFVYRGVTIRNHDHLLGSVEGVDGIKTGFTTASGFNLVTSVHRDDRYLLGVVLGGRSASERDAHMRELVSEHFKEASLQRTAPMIAEQSAPHEEPRHESQQVAFAKAPMSAHSAPVPAPAAAPIRAAAQAAGTAHPAGADDPLQPLLVKTVTYRIAPALGAPLGTMPTMVPVPQPAPAPMAPAPMALGPMAPAPAPMALSQPVVLPQPTAPAPTRSAAQEMPRVLVASAVPAPAYSPVAPEPVQTEAVSELDPVDPTAQPERAEAEPARPVASKPQFGKAELAKAESPQFRARGGWLIQIGAFDGQDEAKQHLSDAQSKVHDKLAAADPFTERVQKGDKAFYRARFAGFDKVTAEAACKQLKRNDFECMTVRN